MQSATCQPTARRLFRGEPPAHQDVVRVLVAIVAFDMKYGAKFAARDHIAQRTHRGPEAAIVPDGKCDTRFSAGFEHTSSIGLAQRKRLFTEHGVSRGRAGYYLRRM